MSNVWARLVRGFTLADSRVFGVAGVLSSRMSFLLFVLGVALIITVIMGILNVELFFGGYYTRALVALIIAIALYLVFQRISPRMRRPSSR